MSSARSLAIIGPDLVIKGDIRNGGTIEIQGLVEGSVAAEHVTIHNGGRIFGLLTAGSADVDGTLQGQVLVRKLLQIGATGVVHGDVRYGRISMQVGADLDADVRNVPPDIAGDLNLAVNRGGAVTVTTEDLTAIDPDSPIASLVFRVSQSKNGFVARGGERSSPIEQFSHAELQHGAIIFVHDGSGGTAASFDILVTDHAGASSGAPKTVHVAVFR